MSDEVVIKPPTKKQQVFIDEYLKCFNASEASRRAGYKSKPNVSGSQLLANPSISKAIKERLEEFHMSADEALKLLAEQARGDIGEVMDISGMGFNLNMQKAQEMGLTKLIKKVKQKTTTFIAKKESEEDREVTEVEIEMYDSQSAIRDILRVHGKFTDKMDVTSGGEVINVTLVKDSND